MRDLQSTERFEMQNETQRTIKSESSFQAGIDVSAGYGPVSISAFAKFASNASEEEAARNSTEYAKDITEKSLARLVEKVRHKRRTRVLEETEELNEHGFTSGPNNISGVYRWVDKYYRAKVVNYGKRLMYEFFVPEPAAFYLFATQYTLDTKVLPEFPLAPTAPDEERPLRPDDIDNHNYLGLIQQYNAEGVEPPPPTWIRISKALHREIQDSGHWAFSNEEFKVPKGYRAIRGNYGLGYAYDNDADSRKGDLRISGTKLTIDEMEDPPPLEFRGEIDSIPIAGHGFNVRSWSMVITAVCKLMSSYYKKWQIETYTAIMNAYHKALLEYEERLAAAQIQQGVAIGGQNPAINRAIEKQELKSGCLTLWTREHSSFQPGIDHLVDEQMPDNYPQINIDNAIDNATAIEFFENAFDWKNITYEFLPYFWARRERWVDLLPLENNDPIFEQFLKAGAARVVVPVNLAYTEAVLYYQLTAEIWTGGPVPPIDGILDPDAELYNSYVEELADVAELPDIDEDIEIESDDETTWPIKVPTTLVWLQSDSQLPDFES